jgi:AraC-like DNA-binding protein/mannose-6-phosphate isomerase-like protein (cupin superfamily)
MSQFTIKYSYHASGIRSSTLRAFHSHPFYEIYYFHGGKCNYLIGDRIYVLQPGDMILMHGMTLHRPHVLPGEPYVRTTVHFEPAYIEGLVQNGFHTNVTEPFRELRNHLLPMRGALRDEVEYIYQRMDHFYNQRQHPPAYDRFQLAFLDLLMLIHECCRSPLEAQHDLPSDKERHVQNIVSFIEQHYQADVDLKLLEEELHLSKYYLTRIFKEVTGTTIFTYLFQRRINEAKVRFLIDSTASVSDIAYDVGFKHPAHFSRVFKAQVGMPPEKFRLSLRGNRNES